MPPQRTQKTTEEPTSPPGTIKKRRRTTRACDGCHRRGVKCVKKEDATSCESCLSYDEPCTSIRPEQRRGPKVRKVRASTTPQDSPAPTSSLGWEVPQVAHSPAIPMLLEFYHQIIFPLHPIIFWPTFMRGVQAGEHLRSRPFCALVLSACAIASARLRQTGALFFHSDTFEAVPPSEELSEAFHQAASDAIWLRRDMIYTTDELRAALNLNITCIQKGCLTEMRFWLGAYSTMSAVMHFHDETLWPSDLTATERQGRRRLVLFAYQHSVYIAIITSTPLEIRERHINVHEPEDVDDEILLAVEEGAREASTIPDGKDSWMHGWNRATNLYRILEHAVDQLRNSQGTSPSTFTAPLITKTDTSVYTSLLSKLYNDLPPWARTFYDTTINPSWHIYNFQTVNILITMQNARIISTCSNGFTTEEGVAVAKELMDSLARVPQKYLVAINVPVYHQLAGIGGILGKYTTQAASYETLLGVRSVIEDMSSLLSRLQGLHTDSLSAIGRAHTTLVRYATEVDLFIP
ncbi:hypothetical protein BCR35DRAFT_352421 [Leucosporidium creatinivorum]|uniref:Zn(2)-C6 fungal-type domain-containing protein n=1 Tax=Leucosporidium creatinivorum TaxID=106004 RepID=A0A1Y2FDB0_9BASI|nr:hypothetical protein BCR35DRAFT_352421 [Leucosporidium creatinivorum]